MKVMSWNVNGLRAIEKKGFKSWLLKESPDILGIQETKAAPDQLSPAISQIEGYHSYFGAAQRKGYSGVGLYSKVKPLKVEYGLGIPEFDAEGRIIIAYYDNFIFFTCYFPNGQSSEKRLNYKLEFYEAVLDFCKDKKAENLILCGDVNTAHQPIDLKRPKENAKISGFLEIERAWISKLLDCGYIDTFRHLHPEKVQYSWWSYRYQARKRNAGWRLDYFFVSPPLGHHLVRSEILDEVMGSDHCPILLEIGD